MPAVADEGTDAATSRAISTRAGENLAAITYYFGSKDELVSEALIRQARALVEPVVAELMSNRPQLEDLARAVDMLTTLLDERRDQLVGYLACLARAPHQVGLGAEVRNLSRDLGRLLAEEMASQQAVGLVPTWVDPEAMAALIVALVNGVVVGAVVDPDETHAGAIAQQFVGLLVAAGPGADDP
ncbi:MAG TPA: TetR family transcriptional regulator C-terminal domain-containing protein [Acidimicrobiales bacterium]|nr:TetR family transcriptional regulator C-terminal domain-containing protein [Acidimicrobiales bacterium]